MHAAGVAVVVETGAGTGALIPDEQYEQAGATIGDPWAADVVVKVSRRPTRRSDGCAARAVLIGFLAPRPDPEIAASCAGGGQRLRHGGDSPDFPRAGDGRAVLAGQRRRVQGGVAGGVEQSTRFFPMLTTAAGTVKPATVLVLGVGVAGLQALATAKRLGAGPPATTCGPRSPTRSARWARSGSTWASRRPARVATPAS